MHVRQTKKFWEVIVSQGMEGLRAMLRRTGDGSLSCYIHDSCKGMGGQKICVVLQCDGIFIMLRLGIQGNPLKNKGNPCIVKCYA